MRRRLTWLIFTPPLPFTWPRAAPLQTRAQTTETGMQAWLSEGEDEMHGGLESDLRIGQSPSL